jgi:RHS repeat-associated protein
LVSNTVGGVTTTYRYNAEGRPQQLVQKSGAKVWEGEYRAFGELVAETGVWENRLRFPGQYFDQETGNYYNYFRDYDPTTGRYLQSDPIGFEGGLNTYAYVEGNPIKSVDYYGLYGEVGIRPFFPYPFPHVRHCFIRFNGNNNDTLSFSNEGVNSDPNPGGAQYSPIPGNQDDACLRREMNKCKEEHYRSSTW